MNRTFTGRHMLIVMVLFFGTIVAVNVAMAMAATRTFGGTVVDNAYVASQKFNTWLDEAREQDGLNWTSSVSLDAERFVLVDIRHDGRPLAGATLAAVARHPVGREEDSGLAFAPAGNGTYRSTTPLPSGRWLVQLDIGRGGRHLRLIESLS